ncbi:hypothetical protein ACTJJE_13255 [Mycolicibacterium sp. 22603]|uniref:hypothetical protein n=1 Tax=Mycolicibacterium sp. 22603 TaxID=3453950 RepID=UPI003F835E6E
MPEDPEHFHDHANTVYAKAAEEFRTIFQPIISRSPRLRSGDVESDFLLLGSRFALTRQFEAIVAALQLAKVTLGHHSVSFVRPGLEEYLWLTYFARLDPGVASQLYVTLGVNDVLRSAEAVHGYIGDDGMTNAGFPPGFHTFVVQRRAELTQKIRGFNQQLGWPGRPPVASMEWIAGQVGERDLYAYLYSATSRSVHFSAGEGLRRGWGDPTNPEGFVSVEDVDHRLYLSDFGFYQLVRLFISTWLATERWHDRVVPLSEETVDADQLLDWVERFYALPGVPIVLAKEYELIWQHPKNSGGGTQ